jgi:maltose O-acetyltransferase
VPLDADSERAKMIAGQHYRSGDAELLAARIKARQIVQRYGATDPAAVDERQALLVSLVVQLGDDVVLEPPFHCDYGWNITVGDSVYVNVGCVILDCAHVSIGALSLIGPGVQLCAATHPVDPAQREAGHEYALPIVVGRNVWVGADVVIGPGVTIGENSVVGAGSVVTRDVPAGVVAAGNPCRVLRPL